MNRGLRLQKIQPVSKTETESTKVEKNFTPAKFYRRSTSKAGMVVGRGLLVVGILPFEEEVEMVEMVERVECFFHYTLFPLSLAA